ncbi:MAG: hydrolase [Faecalibacterium sp.]
MNKEQNIARFEAEMAKVHRPGMDKLMEYIRKSDFYTAPASTHYHLSCEGGLLQHSLNVLDAMRGLLTKRNDGKWDYRVATHTVDTITDESVILIALLHDLCKTYFYSTSLRNAKNEQTGKWEKVPFYTVDDKMPLGHGCKSAMLAKNYINLTNDEMYAIWWHMGFTDKNADTLSLTAAIDKFPIIWALHTADMMASSFMEGKDGNKQSFREICFDDPAEPSGQYADNPATPSDDDEPIFMEAVPC